jgi:hypothetical protein
VADPLERQERRLAVVRALLLRDVDRIWADLFDPLDPAGSLARIGPLVAARIIAAQDDGLDAALLYADAVLATAFGAAAIAAAVPAERVVGVDRYGRDIAAMLAASEGLYGTRVASGTPPEDAVRRERSFQSKIAGSAVHDTDRAALTGMADPASGWRHPQVAGWARIAHEGACGFCVMLAGRGHAYTSKETAARAKDGSRYHDRCRCGVSVTPMPRGYRDATAEQMYRAWDDAGARSKWGSGSARTATGASRLRT